MNIKVDTALAGLNATIGDYVVLAKKLPQEALAKQGTKLGFELASRLAAIKPGNGSIRSERLAALKAGQGVRVRPELISKLQEKYGLANRLSDRNRKRPQAVYGKGLKTTFRRKGKRLNFRNLAVQAELSAREKGIGYSAVVGRVKGIAQLQAAVSNTKSIYSRGRYNQVLASAGLSVESDGSSLLVTFGSPRSEAGAAIAKRPEIVAEAIDAVTADLSVYIVRKLQEAGR